MLIILFGKAGVGKTYVGELLAKKFGFHFWDGDAVLPETIKQAIKKQQIFTQQMRDQFTQLLIKEITTLKAKHKRLIIAQALYKRKNRQAIEGAFPNAEWVWVQGSAANIENRLKKNNSWISPFYANKMSMQFEPPVEPVHLIVNNTDNQAIIKQFAEYICQEKTAVPAIRACL